MYKSMFANLAWETLGQCHQDHWRILKESYGLVPYDSSTAPTLDQIALDCIEACSDLLFPSIDPDVVPSAWTSISPATLKAYLTEALIDHLIVTFSYRFYCENLQPKSLNEYMDIIFSCTDEASFKDFYLSSIDEHKKTFRKNTKSAYDRWRDKIEATLKLYSEEFAPEFSQPILFSPDEALLPPNWLFSLTFSFAHKKKSPWDITEAQTDIKSFCFIESSQKYPDISLIDKLTGFLTNSKFVPLLIATEEKDTYAVPLAFHRANPENYSPPIMELREVISHSDLPSTNATVVTQSEKIGYTIQHNQIEVLSHPFTALPWDAQKYIVKPIPPQTYRSKREGCDNADVLDITIDPAVQRVFNNYLIECTFHGHALTTILHCLFRHPLKEVQPRDAETHLSLLTESLRIHAPLVHPQFIRLVDSVCSASSGLLGDLFWRNTFISQINKFIDHLNTKALPILEELFLWNIFNSYSKKEIFLAIQDSFLSSECAFRCDKLNFYRLIPQKNDHHTLSEIYAELKKTSTTRQKSEDIKHIIKLHNLVLCSGYLAAMGYSSNFSAFSYDGDTADLSTPFD